MNTTVPRRAIAADAVPAREETTGTPRPKLQPVRTTAREKPVKPKRTRWITPASVSFLVVAILLAWGYRFPTEHYITPQSGLGYALGIIGGSLMLLLMIYPARKRLPGMKAIGTTKLWFQIHMALGVIGPVLILFHANFRLGATNSNVALFCMLVVAGSGLFGRYFYAHIHHGLHGRKASLAELRDYAERLRQVSTEVSFLPELVDRIGAEEQVLVRRCENTFVLARPLAGAIGSFLARRHLRAYVRRELQAGHVSGATNPTQAARLRTVANDYIDSRMGATRRVVEFSAFEQLFSLWHALHMPLFLMLLIAGTVHVVAVHVY
jgi:hypothetical protein